MFVKRVKMRKVLKEVTPLSEKDCFYIVERFKSEFLFPLHSHEEFELNFIEGGVVSTVLSETAWRKSATLS